MRVRAQPVQFARSHSLDFSPPYISQLQPEGASSSYVGEVFCGPTSMAMIARALDRFPHFSDARLIEAFARIGKTNDRVGTSLEAMVEIGRRIGVDCEVVNGSEVMPVRRALVDGHLVVANGNYYAMAPHAEDDKYEGHYILVYGMDGRGRFLVHDPYDPAVRHVSGHELSTFLSTHETGGHLVIARPRQRSSEASDLPKEWIRHLGHDRASTRRGILSIVV